MGNKNSNAGKQRKLELKSEDKLKSKIEEKFRKPGWRYISEEISSLEDLYSSVFSSVLRICLEVWLPENYTFSGVEITFDDGFTITTDYCTMYIGRLTTHSHKYGSIEIFPIIYTSRFVAQNLPFYKKTCSIRFCQDEAKGFLVAEAMKWWKYRYSDKIKNIITESTRLPENIINFAVLPFIFPKVVDIS